MKTVIFQNIKKKGCMEILNELDGGKKRYIELQNTLCNGAKIISSKTLVDRLKDLEDIKLINKTINPRPIEVYYDLTSRGRKSLKLINKLEAQGEKE